MVLRLICIKVNDKRPIICVYAICKDESKFAERWLKSMYDDGNGADYICVLDTGSSDGTLGKLIETASSIGIPSGRLIVSSREFDPWRFDVARNASIELVPECDAMVCTDLDEVLIHDFWEDLRECVSEHPNFNRIYYQYAWSIDRKTDKPLWYFWYDKITKRDGWYWKYPVHEALTLSEGYGYSGEYCLDSNKIYLKHYPDCTKSRSSYLGLLEQRMSEYPEDTYGVYYLAREYSFRNNIEKAVSLMTGLYVRLTSGQENVCDDMGMKPNICCSLGRWYQQAQDKELSEFWFKRGLRDDPTHRELYTRLAELLAYQGRYSESSSVLAEMDKRSVRIQDWRYSSVSWKKWKKLQIEAVNACWSQNYELADKLFMEAVDSISDGEEEEAESEGLFIDFQWLKDSGKLKKYSGEGNEK